MDRFLPPQILGRAAPRSLSRQFVPSANVTLVRRSGGASNLWRAVPLLVRKKDPGSDMQAVQKKMEIQVPCMCFGDCPRSGFEFQGNRWLKNAKDTFPKHVLVISCLTWLIDG